MRDANWVDEQVGIAVAHWAEHGFGPWTLFDRTTDAFVGRVLLRRVNVVERDDVEVGYAFAPERWGEGLATEAALAAIEFAFETAGLDDLICFTLTTNLASQRVMQKAGFTHDRDFEYVGLPHVLYRLQRS